MVSKIDDGVFLDTSFFKALVDKRDDFYTQASSLWYSWKYASFSLVTSNFVIDETFTLLRVRRGLTAALTFRDLLSRGGKKIKIMRILTRDEQAAWEWFERDWSRLSFTDCTSFALLKRIGLTRVAAFDEHFSRAGFTLLK